MITRLTQINGEPILVNLGHMITAEVDRDTRNWKQEVVTRITFSFSERPYRREEEEEPYFEARALLVRESLGELEKRISHYYDWDLTRE